MTGLGHQLEAEIMYRLTPEPMPRQAVRPAQERGFQGRAGSCS